MAREASRDLREIAAAHNPITIDLATQLYRFLYTRGYDAELRYDHARLEQVAALSQRSPGGVPADAPLEPRPPVAALHALGERAAAEPHRRRHQHELLPDRPAGAARGRVLHPPHLQGRRGLQARPAPLHRLPDREALLARVVHRGRPLALGQAAAAEVRDARLRRRRVPARQERGRVPDPGLDRLRPDPGRRRLRRRAARRREAEGELRLVPRTGAAAAPLRRDPHPLRRADLAAPRRSARPTRAPSRIPTRTTSRSRSSPSRSACASTR